MFEKRFYLSFLIVFLLASLSQTSADLAEGGSIKEPLPSPLMPSLNEALSWELADVAKYTVTSTNLNKKCLDSGNWTKCLPSEIYEVKSSALNQGRRDVQQYLREYSRYSASRRKSRAASLLTPWECKDAARGYALGLSLERDFPSAESILWSREILAKVGSCQEFVFKDEALIRSALFSMLKENCKEALPLLKQVDQENLGVRDRSLYLRKICEDSEVKSPKFLASLKPIPLGMYGHLLLGETEFKKKESLWRVQIRAENDEYTDLLSTMSYYLSNDQISKLRWLADNIDFRRMADKESVQFQVTVALMFHKASVDLPVFKILHQVLVREPELASSDLLPLMFPVRYWEMIQKSAGDDVDPILVKSLIRQESAFATRARSHAQAMGLMQLIPSTARRMGLKDRSKLYDPQTNVDLGTRYFRQMVRQFGSVELALAGYNAGPKRVEEWQKRYQTKNIQLFVEMIPFKETREYVRLIQRNESVYRQVLPTLAQTK